MVLSSQGFSPEEERIQAVNAWSKPKSVRDLLVFFGFVNFYQCFIESFSRIAALLTSIVKTKTSTASAGTVWKTIHNSKFRTPNAKLAFIDLKQAFIKTTIFKHFHADRHVWMKTDAFSIAISAVLS